MDNLDINKMLNAISKMDKDELEKNIYKAKKILESTNMNMDINKNSTKKDEN